MELMVREWERLGSTSSQPLLRYVWLTGQAVNIGSSWIAILLHWHPREDDDDKGARATCAGTGCAFPNTNAPVSCEIFRENEWPRPTETNEERNDVTVGSQLRSTVDSNDSSSAQMPSSRKGKLLLRGQILWGSTSVSASSPMATEKKPQNCRVGHSVGDTMGNMENNISNSSRSVLFKMKIRARSLWERGLSWTMNLPARYEGI